MIVTEIRCDECDCWGDGSRGSERPHILRKGLREQRWAVSLPGGKDLCPRCREIGRERQAMRDKAQKGEGDANTDRS